MGCHPKARLPSLTDLDIWGDSRTLLQSFMAAAQGLQTLNFAQGAMQDATVFTPMTVPSLQLVTVSEPAMASILPSLTAQALTRVSVFAEVLQGHSVLDCLARISDQITTLTVHGVVTEDCIPALAVFGRVSRLVFSGLVGIIGVSPSQVHGSFFVRLALRTPVVWPQLVSIKFAEGTRLVSRVAINDADVLLDITNDLLLLLKTRKRAAAANSLHGPQRIKIIELGDGTLPKEIQEEL